MVQMTVVKRPTQIIEEDKLANLIGQFGKWQLILCLTVPIVKFSAGWILLAIVFLTPQLTFWCKNFGENSTRIGDNMTCYSNCLEYDYDTTPFENTIISEWDLVCERAWLASFTQTILQLGVSVGSILFGILSDRYGRKNAFLLSVVLIITFGFGIPFSPNYMTFTILRFFLGVAAAGNLVVSFVLVMENIGPKYREVCGCLFQVPYMIAQTSTPLFSYFYRSWDSYSLAVAMPSLLYLVYFFTLTESPRWLISVGKIDQASYIVTRAVEMNKLQTETKVEQTIKNMSEEIRSTKTVKPHYGDLFKGSLLIKSISSSILWFITGFTYFGVNQYVGQTSPNPFISVAAAGALQIPSLFMTILTIKYLGRKVSTITFLVLGGLCVLTLAVVTDNFYLNLAIACLGISFITIVATGIYIYSSELFPTVVRNMSMGVCSTSMRIGSMIAPFVSNLSTTAPWLPPLIFGLTPLAAALVCLLLPETKGKALQDSIEEVKDEK